MQTNVINNKSLLKGSIPFAVYFAGGLLIFLFGSNTFELFQTNRNAVYEWGLTLFLLVLALIARGNSHFHAYWKILFGLFAAGFANALNLSLGNWLVHYLPKPNSDAEFIAIDKLSQGLPIIISLILLTVWSGDSLGSIYLQKGKLREGLRFGFISFGLFVVLFVVIAILQSYAPSSKGLTAGGIRIDTILSATPWILVFVFANSLMEELWYRGICLGKLRSALGPQAAVIVTALVFGISHLGATYITPLEMIAFPVIVFILGLVNGYMMVKTESIWGSVLFHAGYDLIIIIPILVSQG